jgi:hypothetical protein
VAVVSSRKARRAWILVPLAAVLIAAVASAPASVKSAGGAKYVTKSFTVAGSKAATVTATCPKATHVLGGGEVNHEPYNSVVVRQTFPFDSHDKGDKPDDGWKVRIKNQTGDSVSIKAEAVCAKTAVSYRALRFVATANAETGQETVLCPAGKFAYSGGVRAPAKSKIFLNSAFPSDPTDTGATGWGTYIDNPTSQDEDKAAVVVVCGKLTPEVTTDSESGITPHTQAHLRPLCPVGKHAWGGGMDTSAGFETAAISSLGPDTLQGIAGGAWRSNPDMTGPTPHFVNAYSVCGPKLN